MADPSTRPRCLSAARRPYLLLLTLACALAASPARAQSGYTWRNVVIKGGGFVTGIEFHPTAPGVIYARTDVGGAYRWNAATSAWVPLLDWLGRDIAHYMGVDAIAVDPSDANRVYVVGGQYTQDWAGFAAVLRSADRGATFQVTSLQAQNVKMGGNENGRSMGERLAVDPNLGTILFLATRNQGLWRSADRGATWSRVAGFPVSTTSTGAGLSFVKFVSGTVGGGAPTQLIYVGAAQQGGTALYRSTDAGTTWQPVAGQPTNMLPHHAALDADGVTLYLTYDNWIGPNDVTSGAVWRHDTLTGQWTAINPPAGQGGFGGVSADRQRTGRLVVTTMDRWGPRDEVYLSTNRGASWITVFDNATFDRGPAPWTAVRNPHWLGDVEIDPTSPDRVLFITGYGIWACDNLTAAEAAGSTRWVFRNEGLEEFVPLDLVSPPTGSNLLSALGDQGGFRHLTFDSSPTLANHFTHATTNTSLDFAEENPSLVARVHWGNPRGSYSLDGGGTWTDFATAPSEALAPYPNGGPNGIAVSPDGSTFVWWPKNSAPYYSLNRGASWTPSAPGTPREPNSWQVMWPVADRVNSDKFYIYHVIEGRVYVSTNGGASWTPTATPGPDGTLLRAVPGREGHLWLPLQWNGFFRSIDSGQTFQRVTTVQEGYQVGFGRSASGTGYPAIFLWGRVNNVTGLFRSDDEGASWLRINDDVRQFGWINMLTGDRRVYGRVYLATGGRGIVYGEPGGTGTNQTLAVTKAGTGAGTVTSSPAGINCGAGCGTQSASFPSATSVTLTAAAAAGSTFAGWSGACTGAGGCTVSMTQARAVTATFNATSTNQTLTVNKAGTGTGTVTSSPAGINCGAGCTTQNASFPNGTNVTLTASAATGSTFAGWSGACTGTGGCTVAMTQVRTVTATFNTAPNNQTLTVNKAGTGTGTVTSTPAGISCGAGCGTQAASFANGTNVTLSAVAASGSTFAGWSGACTGTGGCTVAMTQARAVTATFNTTPTGNGGVTVSAVVGGSPPWYFENRLGFSNTAPLTALTVTVVVQRTAGITFNGQYNTVGSFQQSSTGNANPATITYTWTLSGTLPAGTGRLLVAQMNGAGTPHPSSGDTWTLTYTTGGQSYTQSGTF